MWGGNDIGGQGRGASRGRGIARPVGARVGEGRLALLPCRRKVLKVCLGEGMWQE